MDRIGLIIYKLLDWFSYDEPFPPRKGHRVIPAIAYAKILLYPLRLAAAGGTTKTDSPAAERLFFHGPDGEAPAFPT